MKVLGYLINGINLVEESEMQKVNNTNPRDLDIAFSSKSLAKSLVITFVIVTLAGLFLGVKVAVERPPETVGLIALVGVVWVCSLLLLVSQKISFDVDQKIRSLEKQLKELHDKEMR